MKLKLNNTHIHDYNYDDTNGDPYQNDVRLSEKISNEQKHDTPELTNKLNISDNKFEVKTPEECQKEYFAKQEEFPGICGRHGLTFMLDGYEPPNTQENKETLEGVMKEFKSQLNNENEEVKNEERKTNEENKNDETEKTEELKENKIEENKNEENENEEHKETNELEEPQGPQIGLMTFKNK